MGKIKKVDFGGKPKAAKKVVPEKKVEKPNYRQMVFDRISNEDKYRAEFIEKNKEVIDKFFKQLEQGVENPNGKFCKIPAISLGSLQEALIMSNRINDDLQEMVMMLGLQSRILQMMMLNIAVESNGEFDVKDELITE